MLLAAGNVLFGASSMAQQKVQAPSSKLAGGDVCPPANTPPCSGLSSPLSVSSPTGAHSGSGSTSTDEFLAAKTTGVPTAPVSIVEPRKAVTAATMLTSGTLAISFSHYCSFMFLFLLIDILFRDIHLQITFCELSFVQLCLKLGKHPWLDF